MTQVTLDEALQAQLNAALVAAMRVVPEKTATSRLVGAVLVVTYDDGVTCVLGTVDGQVKCVLDGIDRDPTTALLEGSRDAIDQRLHAKTS